MNGPILGSGGKTQFGNSFVMLSFGALRFSAKIVRRILAAALGGAVSVCKEEPGEQTSLPDWVIERARPEESPGLIALEIVPAADEIRAFSAFQPIIYC